MIYFVGAGSGDKELITVKGAKLLSKADVIIYTGSLINHELLEFAKEDAKTYNSAYLNLDEVCDIFMESEKAGLMTVRLHTGDMSLYGAVKEQYDFLSSHNISFEVVPGVSSFLAAAASLKAEYTLPGVSQSVVITRYPGKTKTPDGEFEKLAAIGCSMAIFLSMNLIDEVSKSLIDGGAFSENSPAAIVYKASWKDEKIIRCHVGNLGDSARKNGITKTSLIVVGRFLDSDYELSKLYDRNFETEFRKVK